MVITEEWLERHKSKGCAWTYAQLRAIGAPVPPVKGWKKLVVGKTISEQQAVEFITGKDVKHRGRALAKKNAPKQKNTSPQLPIEPTQTPSPKPIIDSRQPSRSISTNPADTVIWFGKHKGKRLSDIPREYLDWCLKERAGGGELVSDIAAFLHIDAPKKVVKYAGETMTEAELQELAKRPGFTKIEKIVDGVDVLGLGNCSDRFDPHSPWPDEQQWDGVTAPWLDQGGELDREFRQLIG